MIVHHENLLSGGEKRSVEASVDAPAISLIGVNCYRIYKGFDAMRYFDLDLKRNRYLDLDLERKDSLCSEI